MFNSVTYLTSLKTTLGCYLCVLVGSLYCTGHVAICAWPRLRQVRGRVGTLPNIYVVYSLVVIVINAMSGECEQCTKSLNKHHRGGKLCAVCENIAKEYDENVVLIHSDLLAY